MILTVTDPDTDSEVTRQLGIMIDERRRIALATFEQNLHPTASIILDKGAQIILSGGGAALTMRMVAREAGIKLASVQYHFGTFDDLSLSLFMREFGKMSELVWHIFVHHMSSGKSPEEIVMSCSQDFFSDYDELKIRDNRIYFHLMAFCSYSDVARTKSRAFYDLFNTVIAILISRVNRNLDVEECLARSVLLTSIFEGASVYTILDVGGSAANAALHRKIGDLALGFARS